MPVPTNEVTIGRQFEVAEQFELTLRNDTGDQDLFVITGGPIYLQELVGIVTTAITASGTVIAHLQLEPDPIGGAVDMCLAVAGLDIVAAVDSQFTITGAPAVAMVETATGVVVAPSFLTNHQICAPGTIVLSIVDTGAGNDVAGAITWTIVYRPLVYGVSVVAA